MSTIVRGTGKGKRTHNRQEMNKLNRTALIIGGVAAGCLFILMVVSFLMP